MGLNEKRDRPTFVNFSEGKFKVGKKNEGFKLYSSLSGKITGVSFDNNEYQGVTSRQIVISLSDDDGKFVLSTKASNGYGIGILYQLPLVDFSQEVEFSASYDHEAKKANCFLSQNGKSLKRYWTKDNPRDLPQLENLGVVKGKTVWSGDKQQAYFEEYVAEHIAPKIAAAMSRSPSHSHDAGGDDDDGGDEYVDEGQGEDDQVPF